MQYHSVHHIEASVRSCLHNEDWFISFNLRNMMGSTGMDVLRVKTDHLNENRIVWTGSKSEDYNLKDTYNAIRTHSSIKESYSPFGSLTAFQGIVSSLGWLCRED